MCNLLHLLAAMSFCACFVHAWKLRTFVHGTIVTQLQALNTTAHHFQGCCSPYNDRLSKNTYVLCQLLRLAYQHPGQRRGRRLATRPASQHNQCVSTAHWMLHGLECGPTHKVARALTCSCTAAVPGHAVVAYVHTDNQHHGCCDAELWTAGLCTQQLSSNNPPTTVNTTDAANCWSCGAWQHRCRGMQLSATPT